jgi:hypothetical protein
VLKKKGVKVPLDLMTKGEAVQSQPFFNKSPTPILPDIGVRKTPNISSKTFRL